jgi:ParB family chromosome partitioning protein
MAKSAVEDGKRLNAFAVDAKKLTIIGLDTDDGPEHPLYDKRVKLPVDENLAKDMLMNGFRGAIEVRKNGQKLEVVFGRQRVRAARLANEWAKERGRETVAVSCFVKKGSDSDFLGVRVGENVHRRGLGVLDMSDELKKYLNMGRTEDEAAVTFGMTKNNIKNLMKLHDLAAPVRKAVENELLSPSAAAALADLERDEQVAELEKMLAAAERGGPKVTRKTAKKAAKSRKNGAEVTVAPPKRLITKVLQLDKKNGSNLPTDFVRGIMWALGDIGPGSIGGLTALIREVEEAKAAKGKKAEA